MHRCKYILVVIVTLLFRPGTCIKCYNCVSTTNADCLDPRGSDLKAQECNVEFLQKLSDQVTEYANNIGVAFGLGIDSKRKQITLPIVCLKIESVEVNKEKMVVRGCHLGEDAGVCTNVEKHSNNGMITHCSFCHEDECNAAHWLSPFSLGTLIISVITLRAWNLFV